MADYITFQPSDYFDTKIYTQTGSNNNGDTQTITMDNVGFTWFKNRSYANAHALFDIVRGGDKLLATNGTAAAETVGGGITFGASSTTIGADTGGYGFNNRVGDNYVGWHWRTDGTTGSSNTDGSITSTVSVNTTAGFSIVKWTGTGSNATIGHGLGATPKCFIIKKTSGTSAWSMYHESVGNTAFMTMNSDAASTTGSTVWNNTSPTSSVFSVGTADNGNASGATYIGYFFAEKRGYCKIGEYIGNGSTWGPFINCGFRPAFMMIKRHSNTGSWLILDNKRDPINQMGKGLFPHLSNVEATGYNWNFLSNGFKPRVSGSGENGSGSNYLYMAFAEFPFVGSNDTPGVAR